MCSVTKATLVQFIDGKCHIKKQKNHETALSGYYTCLSRDLLRINVLGGGHTHIHQRSWMKQFQETRHVQAWFKKELRIAIKQVVSYLAKKLLAAHSPGSIGYYLCLFMQIQFQLSSYIHGITNEHIFYQFYEI